MWRSALVLLLIVQLATASSTVHVSDGRSLVAAITNSAVSNITLDNDVRLSSGDWPDGVYRLNRNLTIQSDPHGRHLVSSPESCSHGMVLQAQCIKRAGNIKVLMFHTHRTVPCNMLDAAAAAAG